MKPFLDSVAKCLILIQVVLVGERLAELLYRLKLYVVDCGGHHFYNHVDGAFFAEYRSAFVLSLVITPLVLLWSQSRFVKGLSISSVILALTLLLSVNLAREQGVIISYEEYITHGGA